MMSVIGALVLTYFLSRALRWLGLRPPSVTRLVAAHVLSFALLNEASTVTYRDGDVMLSTVADFRPGTYADQHHVWQATLDEDAIVFTTHPKNEPFEGADSWPDDDGCWTERGNDPEPVQ